MAKPFDATLKHLVEAYAADWLAFAGYSSSKGVEAIDTDLSTVTALADKVLRVVDDVPWLLHLELQANYDSCLAERLHWYNTLLRHRHGLKVRSTVVLLRPAADGSDVTGNYQEQFSNELPYLVFHYHVMRIWQIPAESFLTGGLGLLPLAPLSEVAEEALPTTIRKMEQRLMSEVEPAESATLLTSAYVLSGARWNREISDMVFRGALNLMKESTTYQKIVDEGRAVEARRVLKRRGTRLFGAPTSDISTTIDSISDLPKLEALIDRIEDVRSWAELMSEV